GWTALGQIAIPALTGYSPIPLSCATRTIRASRRSAGKSDCRPPPTPGRCRERSHGRILRTPEAAQAGAVGACVRGVCVRVVAGRGYRRAALRLAGSTRTHFDPRARERVLRLACAGVVPRRTRRAAGQQHGNRDPRVAARDWRRVAVAIRERRSINEGPGYGK